MGYQLASPGSTGVNGPKTSKGYVGRLGDLLAEYEEEREAEEEQIYACSEIGEAFDRAQARSL